MSILNEQAFPLPAFSFDGRHGYEEGSRIPGMTKLELFTLHAMVAVTGSYSGTMKQSDYDDIARTSRLIAKATLLGLKETEGEGI